MASIARPIIDAFRNIYFQLCITPAISKDFHLQTLLNRMLHMSNRNPCTIRGWECHPSSFCLFCCYWQSLSTFTRNFWGKGRWVCTVLNWNRKNIDDLSYIIKSPQQFWQTVCHSALISINGAITSASTYRVFCVHISTDIVKWCVFNGCSVLVAGGQRTRVVRAL